MPSHITFDIHELEKQLGAGNRFMLVRTDFAGGEWDYSYYMSRMDCSAEMKSDRESSGRYDIYYVLLEIRAIIKPGEIYTGFER